MTKMISIKINFIIEASQFWTCTMFKLTAQME